MLTLFVEVPLAKEGLKDYLLKTLKPVKAPKERESSIFLLFEFFISLHFLVIMSTKKGAP